MSALRRIDPRPHAEPGAAYAGDTGKRPKLGFLRIADLRVDMGYQREIGRRGSAAIRAIAKGFTWSSFEAATVAPIAGGLYAIINGQHRVTAAALRGMTHVPCLIVEADREQQAASFAEINTQVTAVTPMQLHAARLAAGDRKARKLAKICEAAGVAICRYPVPAKAMKPGETMAVGKLASALARYGDEVLTRALMCITDNADNVGMVRAPVIEALCAVFESEPAWRDHKSLVAAMHDFDFARSYAAAGKASFEERCSITSKLVDLIGEHLERRLK